MDIGRIQGYGLGGRRQAASDDLKQPQWCPMMLEMDWYWPNSRLRPRRTAPSGLGWPHAASMMLEMDGYWPNLRLWPWKLLYDLWTTLEVGLKRPQGHIITYNMDHDLGMASEAGTLRPQMASMLPNDARNGWILAKFEVMASEVGLIGLYNDNGF